MIDLLRAVFFMCVFCLLIGGTYFAVSWLFGHRPRGEEAQRPPSSPDRYVRGYADVTEPSLGDDGVWAFPNTWTHDEIQTYLRLRKERKDPWT